MATKRFTLVDLEELDVEISYEWRGNEIDTRWNRYYDVVFMARDGKMYKTQLCQGLTEYQETYGAEVFPELTFDRETNVWSADLPEVELYEEMFTVTSWRKVKDPDAVPNRSPAGR